jgi:hypothetical protein
MTAQDFASRIQKPSLLSAAIRTIYLVAIGSATVGWVGLLAWCVLALLGY